MNSKNENKTNSMLYISFNQDNSFFSIGTEKGFLIYQTNPFKGPYERNMDGGIGIVEMINNSNYLALIGGGDIPRFGKNTLVIWDDNENKVISELKFTTPILSIKYKKDYLFVVCQKRIYIFNFENYEISETIDTGNNKKELIAINQISNPLILAYPSIKNENKISIKNSSKPDIIRLKVQDDSVSKISINNDGSLLASANENGTVIRIHSCSDGTFLQEFKRGIEKAKINSICFDMDTKFMAVSSSRGTIHIFSMGSTIKNLREHETNKQKGENNNDGKKNKKDKKKKDKKKEDKKEKDKENKIEDDKEKNNENKIEINNDENNEKKFDDINKDNDKFNSTSEEETKDGKESENKNGQKENEDIKETKKNEIIENNKEEEKLPENSKTFLGGIFGSRTEKSFAKVRIKSQESICAFIRSDLLAIVTSDNKYDQYEIDLKNGGDCKKKVDKNITLNK